MEIDQLATAGDHDKGADMQVLDQYGEKLDCFITLAGIDSKLYRTIYKDAQRKFLKGENYDDDAEILAKITLGWKGFKDKGKALKFSKVRIKQLYIAAPYIMDQADRFIIERKNFTKG